MGKNSEGLPRASGSGPMLVDGKAWNQLVDAVSGRMIVLDPSQFDKVERGGETYYRYRTPVPAMPGTPGASSGRFVPRVGGEGGTTLYLSPGCVVYCRLEEDAFGESDTKESHQVKPLYPTLDGTPLNAEEPPGFGLSGKSGASVWLITDRTRCPNATFVPGEDDDPDRIEILDKGDRPAREDGKMQTLICEMDFETAGGGSKTITNLDQRWQSDWQVWFTCIEQESEVSSVDYPGSSDVGSSQEVDDPDSSGESKDCPWAGSAAWKKQNCYRRTGQSIATWRVAVGLETVKMKCAAWRVCCSMPDGTPINPGGSSPPGAVCRIITGRRLSFDASFKFEPAPDCEGTYLDVWIEGLPHEGDSDPDECCSRLPSKRFNDRWPHHCGFTCTTVVTPP